jgi:hypothetical protein
VSRQSLEEEELEEGSGSEERLIIDPWVRCSARRKSLEVEAPTVGR